LRELRTSGQAESDYQIQLLNDEGEVLDSFSDIELGQGYFEKMKNLFGTARRTALGTEKVLDEIIGELDDDMPF
jgi:hypothetical protein